MKAEEYTYTIVVWQKCLTSVLQQMPFIKSIRKKFVNCFGNTIYILRRRIAVLKDWLKDLFQDDFDIDRFVLGTYADAQYVFKRPLTIMK